MKFHNTDFDIFKVDYDDFFEFKNNDNLRKHFENNVKLCENPMKNIIDRYNIKNKDVLAVAAKVGFEEYWFYKIANDKLTFCDIDEHKDLKPYLKSLPVSTSQNCLTYIIADVNAYMETLAEDTRFDVCYISSFTVDELHKLKAVRGKKPFSFLYKKTIKKIISGLLFKIYNPWQNVNPFCNSMINIFDKALRNNGLFICQSYASCVFADDPNFINATIGQLKEINIHLLEIYAMKNNSQVYLMIGYKGAASDAMAYYKGIQNNPDISAFHGRSFHKFNGIKKIYELDYI